MSNYDPNTAITVTKKLNDALDWFESLSHVDRLNVQALLDNDKLFNIVVTSKTADQTYIENLTILKAGQMAATSLGERLNGYNTNTLPRSEEG